MTGDTLVVNGLGIHVLSQNWFSKQSIARDNKNQPVTVEQLELPSPSLRESIRVLFQALFHWYDGPRYLRLVKKKKPQVAYLTCQ